MLDKGLKIKLDRYLKDELSAEEKISFKKLLSENKELREEYLFLKDAADALLLVKRKELQEKFERIEREEQQKATEAANRVIYDSIPKSYSQLAPSGSPTRKTTQKKRVVVLMVSLVAFLFLGLWLGSHYFNPNAPDVGSKIEVAANQQELIWSEKVPIFLVLSRNIELAYRPPDSIKVAMYKSQNSDVEYTWNADGLAIYTPHPITVDEVIRYMDFSSIETTTSFFLRSDTTVYELSKNAQNEPLRQVLERTLKSKLVK